MSVGVVLGAAGGWIGGWLDEAAMRVTDAVYGFPAVLSALLVTSVFGPGVLISMVAVGIAYVPVFARLTRANVLSLRAQEFVTAARALGARDGLILWRHVLPNTVSPLIVQATISFPLAILAEAACRTSGSPQPPHPSWGSCCGGPELLTPPVRGLLALPSRSQFSASTCSVTGSATSWIHHDPADAPHRAVVRGGQRSGRNGKQDPRVDGGCIPARRTSAPWGHFTAPAVP
jgi:hypothetical protein